MLGVDIILVEGGEATVAKEEEVVGLGKQIIPNVVQRLVLVSLMTIS